jgi:hypothetical protein
MIAGLIFILSFLTLLQFYVSYSRSLIAESQEHRLSEQTREICGLSARTLTGDQFERLQQLIALCPESGEDGFKVRAVALYFEMLGVVQIASRWVLPSVAPWIEAERGGCAYAAAVALDRRIAYNRMIISQQLSR